MEPKYETRQAFTIVGMLYRGKNQNKEIPALWEQFGPRMHEILATCHPDLCYGACASMEPDGTFEYLAGIEVTTVGTIPGGMVNWEIPSNTYAVFETTLPEIGKTFDRIYQEWLPGSGKSRAEGPEFELYPSNFDPSNPASIFYVYIPVR